MCRTPTPTLLRQSAQRPNLLRSGPLGQARRTMDLVKGACRTHGGESDAAHDAKTLPIAGAQFKQNHYEIVKSSRCCCQATVEMSGLCGRRCSSLRSQASAPRMIRSRRDRAPRWVNRLGLNHLDGPCCDRVKGERSTLVRDPHGPIHRLFHEHVGRPDSGPHLVEVPVMGHRPIPTQAS
jgi:hypothetical protein